MRRNLTIELWLRKRGLIQFVVSIATVADHIDNDISTPLMAILYRRFECCRYCERVVPIAVKDWAIEGLPNIRAVGGGTRVNWVGCETNLVVYNNVDSTTNIEIVHTCHLHRLVNDPLTGEGGITVQQNGHDITDIFWPVERTKRIRCVSALLVLIVTCDAMKSFDSSVRTRTYFHSNIASLEPFPQPQH